jgi:hypothetical protein
MSDSRDVTVKRPWWVVSLSLGQAIVMAVIWAVVGGYFGSQLLLGETPLPFLLIAIYVLGEAACVVAIVYWARRRSSNHR